MTRQEAKTLLAKYIEGSATPDEQLRLEQWYHREQDRQRLAEDEADFLFLKDAIWQATLTRAGLPQQRSKTRHLWTRLGAAVTILLTLSISLYFFMFNSDTPQGAASSEIVPGANRAVLTLVDGRTISLSEEQAGIVVGNGISYLDGSHVVEQGTRTKEQRQDVPSGTEKGNLITNYYVLTTPKGGTYQVTLSDGSKVWLNAASTIRYPSQFVGNERAVEISGEAYFSVTTDKTKPFKVTSDGQTVEVLGTEFNISAYADEQGTKTTLVEGVVQIVNQTSKIVNKLRPGTQSTVRGARIDIKEVDVEKHVAWKSGEFFFKHTPFPDMIAQVARWYDIEVVYEGKVPTTTFSGDMKRSVSLMTVLDMLKISNIPFRIEGKKLIIEQMKTN